MTGFIVAVALVRPSKSISDVKVKSVTKKFKDRSFAALVSREDIIEGADDLDMEISEHVGMVLEAMKSVAGISVGKLFFGGNDAHFISDIRLLVKKEPYG